MPAIVAFFIRQLLIIGVQLGLFATIDRYVTPILNKAIEALMVAFGVPEKTAEDILANEIITTAESLGLTVALSKARLPLRIADKLGFSTRGFNRRTIPATTAAKIPSAGISRTTGSTLGGILGKGILTLTGGLLAWNVLTDWVWIGSSLNFLPGEQQKDIQKRALAIIDLIDAPRSIIYSAEKVKRSLTQQERDLIRDVATEAEKQIDALHVAYAEKFVIFGGEEVALQEARAVAMLKLQLQSLRQMAGLIPRQPIRIAETTAKVTTVYDGDTVLLNNGETLRLVGIDAPESTTTAGEASKRWLKARIENKQITVKSDPDALTDIYGRRLGVIELDGANINIEMLRAKQAVFSEFAPNVLVLKKQWVAAEKETSGAVPAPAAFKIFTGVIQQGTLGAPVELVARETDLISNQDQLQHAASVNIGQFWRGLAGKILYDLKIVSSVQNKNGTIRRGTTQSAVVGTKKDGSPKTKIVTNKFAIVDIFILTSKKSRIKIDRIILGPVDALMFRPSQIQLDNFAAKLPENITTSNTDEIIAVVSSTPTLDLPRIEAPPAPTPAPVEQMIRPTSAPPAPTPAPVTAGIPPAQTPTPATTFPGAPTGAPTVAIPHSINSNRCSADSIAEFFDPAKIQFPSIALRAEHYEQYGFGPAAWYAGTAEQNARVLQAYKRQIGCA